MYNPIKLALILVLFSFFMGTQTSYAQSDSTAIELNIFPNPNRGTFYITTIRDDNYTAQLYAMNGDLVKAFRINSGRNYLTVEAPSGIYLLRVQKDELQQQFKVVIN